MSSALPILLELTIWHPSKVYAIFAILASLCTIFVAYTRSHSISEFVFSGVHDHMSPGPGRKQIHTGKIVGLKGVVLPK
jgi:hypothetical protein